MPHKHSASSRIARRDRARQRGYIKPVGKGKAHVEVESELARQRREAQEARERSKAAERAKVIEANRAFEAAKARAGSTVSTLRDDEQDAARKNALEASKALQR